MEACFGGPTSKTKAFLRIWRYDAEGEEASNKLNNRFWKCHMFIPEHGRMHKSRYPSGH